MRIRLFFSMAFTSTWVETPYISQSHRTRLPASSLPLPLENQKRDVRAGSTNASNTSATGLRMSICALTTGAWIVFVMSSPLLPAIR